MSTFIYWQVLTSTNKEKNDKWRIRVNTDNNNPKEPSSIATN